MPGWTMRRNDRYIVSDHDGDGHDDLIAYNPSDWSTQHLGVLIGDGRGRFGGGLQTDWIGSWNLGSADRFMVADFGATGRKDLLVHNDRWLGTLESSGRRFRQTTIHPDYIKDHEYHVYRWW